MESSTEKAGGMSFEVILKPASSDAAPPHAGSPTKDRPLSQGDIDRKLKEAEDRRHVIYDYAQFDNSLSLTLTVFELHTCIRKKSYVIDYVTSVDTCG